MHCKAVITQTYTLQVGAEAINRAPSITSTPSALAPVGKNYTYTVQATDPDAGDTITYQLLEGPAGMTIDWATGLVLQVNLLSAFDSLSCGGCSTFHLIK